MADLVDSHAHLEDDALWMQVEAVVDRATQAGVRRILTVGSDLTTSRKAVEAAHRFAIVYAAVGVHPHRADRFRDEREDIEALLDAEKVVAVGEIGLDYYRGNATRAAQVRAFQAQLQWARERGIPASIHNREADDDVLELIASSGATAVLHAFSSPERVAADALRLGAFVSFAGNITYPRAESLRSSARLVPTDRLLLESDAPVLAPQPRRGRTNEPSFVAFTLDCLSDVRNVAQDELASQIAATADNVFRWGSA